MHFYLFIYLFMHIQTIYAHLQHEIPNLILQNLDIAPIEDYGNIIDTHNQGFSFNFHIKKIGENFQILAKISQIRNQKIPNLFIYFLKTKKNWREIRIAILKINFFN